jgi:nicotinamidase-related amidase
MAVTVLDPKTALIVIDLQKGVAALTGAHPMADIIERSAALAAAFRRRGLPVVLVNATGVAPGRADVSRGLDGLPAEWFELVPELGAQPDDILVTKQTWGAFTNTDLEAQLRKRGVTQVVVTGVATSAGVESTARFAHELGFNVTLATDAMTDLSLEAHENSVAHIFPRMAETGTTDEILALLGKASNKTEGA